MAVTRSIDNVNRVTDWTQEVNELPNQYGLLNQMGNFMTRGVSQTAVVFDRTEYTTDLLNPTQRGSKKALYGSDRDIDTFSLPLSFYKHSEYITTEDVQGWRMPGEPHREDELGRVIAGKLMRARQRMDQSREYMKIQAIKGLVTDSNGVNVANMFTLFNQTQTVIDFQLNSAGTDVDGKIRQLKTAIQKNARTGMIVGSIMVLCDPLFFDQLIAHAKIREAYQYYQNSGRQIVRDDLSRYEAYGILDMFEHRGVMFMSYDATFTFQSGTSQNAFSDYEGYSFVPGVNDAYRSYYGPSDKLTGANQVGQEMFAFEYRDPMDEYHMIQLESAPLHLLTKPQLSVRVTTPSV